MKLILNKFGGFRLKAVNDLDKLWFESFTHNLIQKDKIKDLEKYFHIEMEDNCVWDDELDADGEKVYCNDLKISQALEFAYSKGRGTHCIESISFDALI